MTFPDDFVHINTAFPEIIVDLRYATPHNITGKPLYNSNNAYLKREAAEALANAHGDFQKSGIGIKIWDAYRPLSVQWELWNVCPDSNFIADPRQGSYHNRGMAVDITLVDASGNNLAMPTEFDDFSAKAASQYPDLAEEIRERRQFLQNIMTSHGFITIKSEWWHFMIDTDSTVLPNLDIPL